MNNFWGHNLFSGAANAGTDRSNDKWASYDLYPGSAFNNNRYNNHRHHHHLQKDDGTTTQSNARWDRPGSSSQNWHSADPEMEEETDGLPYTPDEEDPELTRKRKELQVIEEQIMLKRASLALKTVDVKTYKPELCTEESKPIKSNETLRERVKHILQLRHRLFGTNGPVATSRKRCLSVKHDHPLKRKVAAALQQRFIRPPVEPQKCEPVPFLSTPPPRHNDPLPVKEEVNKSNQGFLRFLNILNKGVDINKLTEIVNDETGNMPHCNLNNIEIQSATSPFESLPIERTKLEVEKQQPSTDEQQKHLQNILESLGLSLGTDEISRLSDRTQERLYGKKQSTAEEAANALEEKTHKEGEEKYSPGHYTRSSSSSESSSLPSRSPCRTPSPFRRRRSPSPFRRRRSPSPMHCRRRQSSWSPRKSSHSRSPHRRRRELRSPHRRKSPRDDRNSHLKCFPQMQPYPYLPSQYFSPHFPLQMYPNAYCYSQYTAYYNYWEYNQALVQRPIGSINQSYPQNIPPLLPNMKSDRDKSIDVQEPPPGTGTNSNEPSAEMEDIQKLSREMMSLNQRNRMSAAKEDQINNWKIELNDVIKAIKKARDTTWGETAGLSVAQGTSEIQQNPTRTRGPKKKKTQGKKPELTEEEIKANLKKTLEAFNNRMKKNVTQPAGLLMPQTAKIEDEI